MNRTATALIAATLAPAAGASFAQSSSSRNIPPTWANEQMLPFTSTVSREQVRAELDAARANGTVNAFDNLAYMQHTQTGNAVGTFLATVRDGAQRVAATQTGGLSREQVKAELEAARRAGELNPFDNLAYMSHNGVSSARVAPAAVAAK